MRFKNKNEVDEPEFQDIMTTEIKYFEDFEKEEDAKKFCEDSEITYLPSKINNLTVYEYISGHFKRNGIENNQKIKAKKKIFDKDVLKLFNKSRVLFLISNDKLKGIVHYSDYNREPVYIYLYSQILNFEKSLRKLLLKNDLKNGDMIKYFEEKSKNGDSETQEHFKGKLDEITRNQDSLKSFSEFQLFYLLDLIFLLGHHRIATIDQGVNNLRSYVMHNKDFIEHKDFEEMPSLYRFSTFEEMFNLVLTLYEEKGKVDELNA
jgi:hypothetical protein